MLQRDIEFGGKTPSETFQELPHWTRAVSLPAIMLDNPDQPRPTLRTIAYLTGLGISTVSRALKDGEEIAVETRARVKLIAQQIGYRPNRAGVRLRTGKTNVITVVLNAEQDSAGFFSDFVYGVSDGLKNSNYHLVITPYSLSDPMEPIRYIVETQSADGVIFSRTQPQDPRVRFLADNNVPFATHGRTELGIVHPFHDFDNEAFAHEAVRILAHRKRRRLTLIGPPPELTYAKHTHQGFERGLQAFGCIAVPMESTNTDATLSELRKIGYELAQLTTRPDGLVCSAVSAAVAIATGFNDAGFVIGKDFDIVTKHTTEFVSMLNHNFISIPEDFRTAGRDVATMVMAAIEGKPPESLQIIAGPSPGDITRNLT
jgi:LacI family transcriptional regulator